MKPSEDCLKFHLSTHSSARSSIWSFFDLKIHGPSASQFLQRTRIEVPMCEQSNDRRVDWQNGHGFALCIGFSLREQIRVSSVTGSKLKRNRKIKSNKTVVIKNTA